MVPVRVASAPDFRRLDPVRAPADERGAHLLREKLLHVEDGGVVLEHRDGDGLDVLRQERSLAGQRVAAAGRGRRRRVRQAGRRTEQARGTRAPASARPCPPRRRCFSVEFVASGALLSRFRDDADEPARHDDDPGDGLAGGVRLHLRLGQREPAQLVLAAVDGRRSTGRAPCRSPAPAGRASRPAPRRRRRPATRPPRLRRHAPEPPRAPRTGGA